MADIDIEKKSSKWPWLLLGALVLIVVLFFVFNDEDDETEMENVDSTENTIGTGSNSESADSESDNLMGTQENVAAVQSFLTVVNDENDRLGIDHNYTHQALTQLIDATQAMADEIGFNIDAEMQRANEIANRMMEQPQSEQHANLMSDAFSNVANALENMQEAHYPDLADEVSKLNEMASALDPEELTLNQRDEVNSYFNQAATILSEMN